MAKVIITIEDDDNGGITRTADFTNIDDDDDRPATRAEIEACEMLVISRERERFGQLGDKIDEALELINSDAIARALNGKHVH